MRKHSVNCQWHFHSNAVVVMVVLIRLYFSAWTHVGEHVARGIAILLLLPKDKHKRGEPWCEAEGGSGKCFLFRWRILLTSINFQIGSPGCRLRARTRCTDRRRSASSSSRTATRAAWTTWPWSGATGGSWVSGSVSCNCLLFCRMCAGGLGMGERREMAGKREDSMHQL